MAVDDYFDDYGDVPGDASPSESDPVEVANVRAERCTARSLVVSILDGRLRREVSLPFSMISASSEVKMPGHRGTLVCPRWLADDRNMTWSCSVL